MSAADVCPQSAEAENMLMNVCVRGSRSSVRDDNGDITLTTGSDSAGSRRNDPCFCSVPRFLQNNSLQFIHKDAFKGLHSLDRL